MPDTLKDPHNVVQALANGPVFKGKVCEMNILTFTQVIARAEETTVSDASNPCHDHVISLSNSNERPDATLNQARMAAIQAAGNA
jgi:hypothetical protein